MNFRETPGKIGRVGMSVNINNTLISVVNNNTPAVMQYY
jgi:hypothetical protein